MTSKVLIKVVSGVLGISLNVFRKQAQRIYLSYAVLEKVLVKLSSL